MTDGACNHLIGTGSTIISGIGVARINDIVSLLSDWDDDDIQGYIDDYVDGVKLSDIVTHYDLASLILSLYSFCPDCGKSNDDAFSMLKQLR